MFISVHDLCIADFQGQLLAKRDATHAHDAMPCCGITKGYACLERCFSSGSVAGGRDPHYSKLITACCLLCLPPTLPARLLAGA